MTGRPPDILDQGAGGPEVPLLVRVEDRDQRHLRQVEPLAKQVDADDDIVNAEPQCAQDLDPLEGVDLAVQVVGANPHLLQVLGEILGHPLGQRGDQRPLVLRDPDVDLGQQVVDLALGRPARDGGAAA